MLRLAFLLPLLASPAIAAPAYSPYPPLYREIGDWVLACDNTHACVAKAVADEQGPAAGQTGLMRFTRAAGPNGEAQVALSTDAVTPSAVTLDGKAVDTAGWSQDSQANALTASGPPALAFMRALRNAATLSLGGQAQVSLKGLAAVLLAMDDDQGRIGNVTAVARPGAFEAERTPALREPPLVQGGRRPPALEDPKGLAAAVRRTHAAALKARQCEAGPQQLMADDAQPLTRDEAIVTLGCVTGAYQGSQLAFRLDRKEPQHAQVLKLPMPGLVAKASPSDSGLYTEANYDPDSAVFSTSAKGRGIADCGFSVDWIFDGRDFQLSGLAFQERCGGEPGDWPTLYRTEAAPTR